MSAKRLDSTQYIILYNIEWYIRACVDYLHMTNVQNDLLTEIQLSQLINKNYEIIPTVKTYCLSYTTVPQKLEQLCLNGNLKKIAAIKPNISLITLNEYNI